MAVATHARVQLRRHRGLERDVGRLLRTLLYEEAAAGVTVAPPRGNANTDGATSLVHAPGRTCVRLAGLRLGGLAHIFT